MENILKAQIIHELMDTKSTVLEMVTENSILDVPVDPRVDVGAITEGDSDPMFVNLEVIRTGTSKVNRRFYNNEVVKQITEMIPGTIGYLGHPDPSKTSFEFREPQCIFVGAMVQELEDGSGGVRTLSKAYIFKSSNLREWIPKSIAAGNPLTVSINAIGDVARDSVNNIIHVQSISELQSIDWANPGTEGVGTARAISVVSEMIDDKGGNTMEKDQIIKGMTLSELQGGNPELYRQVAESGKITEMQLKVDGKDQMVKLTEFQGMLDAKDQKVSELQSQIDGMKLDAYKNTKVLEMVPEAYRDSVSKRVKGSTNEEIDKSINDELSYIKEIAGDINNPPRGNRAHSDDYDSVQTQVRSLFGVKEK